MPILRHVWFGVLPKLLKIVDAWYEQVYHGHENPLPLSSLNNFLQASKQKIEASFSFNQIQVSRRFAQPRLTTLTSLSWGPTSNTKVRGYSEKLTPHVCE